MQAPPISTAGRHAADRRRASDATRQQELQDAARRELSQACHALGLDTTAHLDPLLGDERAVWIACRLDRAAADHALVYAVLDRLNWGPNCKRLGRHGLHYDVIHLQHRPTGAKVAVIVKLPRGEVAQWEAA